MVTAAAAFGALLVAYLALKPEIVPTLVASSEREARPTSAPSVGALDPKPGPTRGYQLPYRLQGKVLFVEDGDTVVIVADGKSAIVRLADTAAPLARQGARPGQKMAAESTAALSQLLAVGTDVLAECFTKDAGDSNVCQVVAGDSNINLRQLERGWAMLTKGRIYDARSLTAEAEARAAKRGVWAQPNPINPEDWRRQCWIGGDCPDSR